MKLSNGNLLVHGASVKEFINTREMATVISATATIYNALIIPKEISPNQLLPSL